MEQEFRTMHYTIKPHLGNNGVITQRYDSNHHKKASITFPEFNKLMIAFVLSHNQMAIDKYPYTADMITNNVHAIPHELWEYGCRKYGKPRRL